MRGSRRALAALMCLALAAPFGAPARAGRMAASEQLPNLVPLPAFDLEIFPGVGSRPGPPMLRFAVATANVGRYGLDLKFENGDPVAGTAEAHQCTAWATDRVCTTRSEVGRFSWHAEHGHHHFEDFALYELRRFRSRGMPDMRRRGLVTTSKKVSFCLMDVEKDDSNSGPLYVLPYPLYFSCLAGAGFQGISPGWRDVYGNSTEGQGFSTLDIPNGSYALVITSDPARRLHETDETDNVSSLGFTLTGSDVEVFCSSEPGELRCLPTDSTEP